MKLPRATDPRHGAVNPPASAGGQDDTVEAQDAPRRTRVTIAGGRHGGKQLQLECVLRLLNARGFTVSEYRIRNGRVYAVNYWPNGAIEDHGEMSLSEFLEFVHTIHPHQPRKEPQS